MIPNRWHQIDRIFQAALDHQPGERAAFLVEACAGDEDLREEVEYLLSCDDRQDCFIDATALEFAASLIASSQPELEIGQQVGHYQILDLLGTGGMGEVYLAQDTLLRRNIALKLLPADFTIDQKRVQRFQQEARAASALNHPNIITIHEISQFEGRNFIATEFIEGETLRQLIRQSKVSLGETLDITFQVVSALQAAHQAGIIHRDIKPENIMIRPDGYVKVLDFGLAKLTALQDGVTDLEASTIDRLTTAPGLVIGTINYMSPEQARGLELDPRSDLFSLGVVMYEMVTGRPPFEGDIPSDLIASILKVEPSPLAQYLEDVPSELQRVITKALEKDIEKRYQTASELAKDLRSLRDEVRFRSSLERPGLATSSGELSFTTNGSDGTIETARNSATLTVGGGVLRTTSSAEYIVSKIKSHKASALVLMVIVMASILYLSFRPRTVVPFQNIRLARLTNSGSAYGAAISPDGKYVAYLADEVGGQSVWVRQVATTSNMQLVAPDGTARGQLMFSSDGNYLYYLAKQKGDEKPSLYKMPVLGGNAQKITENLQSRVTFSPDGNRFAFVRNQGREGTLVISASDGSQEQTVGVYKYKNLLDAAWSPEGETIACATIEFGESATYYSVIGIAVDTGKERTLTVQKWKQIDQLAWLKGGTGLVMSAKDSTEPAQVWQLSYPSGEARRITADLDIYSGVSVTSDSRALVTIRNGSALSIWLVQPGNPSVTQHANPAIGQSDGWNGLAWTQQNKLVYASYDQGKQDIWEMDSDGHNQRQLTVGSGQSGFGVSVSPDGRYIVFVSDRAGKRNIWRANIDGGNLSQLTSGGGEFFPFFSTDGQSVLYSSGDLTWQIPTEGGEPTAFSSIKDILEYGISPDGKMLAHLLPPEKPGFKSVGIFSLEHNSPLKVLNLPSSARPRRMRWSADGRAITYIDERNGVCNIWSQPLADGPPKQLTSFNSDQIWAFAWSLDGKHLACVRGPLTNDVVLINSTN